MRKKATLAVVALLPLWGGDAVADFTWDGGGADDLFSTDENWDPDGAPSLDLLGESLIFGSTGGVDQAPDVAGDDFANIGGLSFTGADASYTITDSSKNATGSLEFVDGAEIINDSAILQTIDVEILGTGDDLLLTASAGDLVLGGDIRTRGVLVTVDGDFNTTISGRIRGANGSLLKQGAGVLTLSGNNTHGATELMAGTIVLGNDSALGSGALAVTGDGTIESDADARSVDNAVSIDDDVTLTFSGGNDLALTGNISGDGGLTINADADDVLLTLSGSNTYAGDTNFDRGTLVLGSNSALGEGDLLLNGDVSIRANADGRVLENVIRTDGNELNVSGASSLTLDGRIFGTDGSLLIDFSADDAALTLGGNNTFDGGTTLNRGTLVFGNNNALGGGDLTIAGNGTIQSDFNGREIDNDIDITDMATTLTFSGDRNLRLNGVISGAGGLTVDADARLVLEGDSTYTGDTAIDGGELRLLGSIMSDVSVNDGGTFSGTGSMTGMLTAADGGTIAPGESIGTLTVTGDYVQESGATYLAELEFDGGAMADLLDISGTATLADGSTIMASVTTDNYIPSDTLFSIMEADGGITDNGSDIVTDSATLTVEFIRDPAFTNGDTVLGIRLLRAADAYSNAAVGRNNTSIARSLDSLIPQADGQPTGAAATLLGSLDNLDADDYNATVNQLSPEPYEGLVESVRNATRDFTLVQSSYLASVRAGLEPLLPAAPLPGSLALAGDDPLILAAAIAQADAAGAGQPPAENAERSPWGRYGKIDGVFVDQETTTDRTGFESQTFGGQFGLDYRFTPDVVAGMAIGYAYTSADLAGDRGDLDQHTIRAGPYMGYAKGDWFLDGSVTFGYHFQDGERQIPGLDATADGDFDGFDVTAYLNTGYRLEPRENLYVTPLASLLYTHLDFESFTESGAGGANLSVDDRTTDSLRSRLGANFAVRIPNLTWEPIPYIYAGWEHEFIDADDIEASFAVGGSPFVVDTGSRDNDSAFVGGGVNLLMGPNTSAFFRFERLFASDSDVSGFAMGLRVAF